MYVFLKFCLLYREISFISVVEDKKKIQKMKLFGIILKLRKTEPSCIDILALHKFGCTP